MNAEITVMMNALQAENAREHARQSEALSRLAMLRDDYYVPVYTRLSGHVSSESLVIMDKYINTTQNVYKKILNRLSRTYKKAPLRIFKIGDKILDKESAKSIDLRYNEAGIDRKLKAASLYLNACNTVFLGPVYRDGKLCLDILTPDQVRVVTDEADPSKMIGLLISRERWNGNKKQRYWIVWTAEEHYLLVEIGEYESKTNGTVKNVVVEAVPGNKDMKNPYGVIPWLPVHRHHLEAAFWDETSGTDLYMANVVVGVRNTLLDFAAVWQSFKQIACEADEAPSKGLTLAPDTILWSAGGAKFTVLDLQVAFDAIRGDLSQFVASVSRNYGVAMDAFDVPSQQSGVAVKINNQELIDNWTDQLEIWGDAERRLWDLIKTISVVENIQGFEGIEIDIKFANMGFVDEAAEFDLDTKKADKGVLSPAGFYMKYNDRVVDEAEAETKLTENLAKWQKLRPSPVKFGIVAGDEEGEGEQETA